MGAANANWPRWIFASTSKHFSDAAAANLAKDGITPDPIPYYVEGNERDLQPGALEYFEFRCDGPYLVEVSKDWWRVNIEINILVCTKRNDKDFHRIHTLCGLLVAAFTSNITIFKYGDSVADDQSILTCLTLDRNAGENVVVSQLGQLGTDLLEQQAMVEAYYQGYLDS
jgi:hypothetical protein